MSAREKRNALQMTAQEPASMREPCERPLRAVCPLRGKGCMEKKMRLQLKAGASGSRPG